jgi:hypothetical protein
MKRRWLIPAALILLAAVLAFICQSAVRSTLIVPLMYAAYLVRAFLQSIDQFAYWYLLVAILLVSAFLSLMGGWGLMRMARREKPHQPGPIASLAKNITKMPQGVYYKWLVAQQLADLARGLLIAQEGQVNPATHQFLGRDWNPPDPVRQFLEAGLERWVIFTQRRQLFRPPPATPLDADLDQVIGYLETRMETEK